MVHNLWYCECCQQQYKCSTINAHKKSKKHIKNHNTKVDADLEVFKQEMLAKGMSPLAMELFIMDEQEKRHL
jgi:hypothetical protein